MVCRGRGRDTRPPRRFPQRKPIYAVLQDDFLGHGQELLAQIAVVISRSLGSFLADLDSVHIDL
jgi:hypothetical protein